jgi:hypothetical protein
MREGNSEKRRYIQVYSEKRSIQREDIHTARREDIYKYTESANTFCIKHISLVQIAHTASNTSPQYK